jgi:ubiquinone/menaquinone biosynthesis C-methylase UbiE
MKPIEEPNLHEATVASFGDEWSRYDQSALDETERALLFERYFSIFPWNSLPPQAEGFDMGCGCGRWARLVAPRVGLLHCVDPSGEALAVARRNLAGSENVRFAQATADAVPLQEGSQDFGYSLGVLHHIPDTQAAMTACVRLLKPGAPFLVYLYYRFDNRPAWFRMVWRLSEILRAGVRTLPPRLKRLVTDFVAVAVYWPLARAARLGELLGADMRHWPLYGYRALSFYTMRTDARDRFGTPLEQRFTRAEIEAMMRKAGVTDIVFSNSEPFWCAVGKKV